MLQASWTSASTSAPRKSLHKTVFLNIPRLSFDLNLCKQVPDDVQIAIAPTTPAHLFLLSREFPMTRTK
jgi:hypothetical protein